MKYKKVYIEITNRCNKHCSFCSIDSKDKKEMTLNEFEMVLNNIKPFTKYVYLHVKGEPFMHSNIKGIFDLCIKYDMFINITTNGSLLHKYKETIINCKKIRQLNVSLNSCNDINEAKTIFKTIDEISINNSMSIVYRFWAINDISEKMNVFNELVEYYKLSWEVLDFLRTNKNVCIGDNIYINMASLFEWPSLNHDLVSCHGKCLGTISHVGILSNGTVIPCCLDSNGIINLGNVFEKSFTSIINGSKCKGINEGFKKNVLKEELCRRCSYRKRFK